MTDEFVTNAADPAQVKTAQERELTAHEQHLLDVEWVLSDRRGRRYFREILEHCQLFEPIFTGNSETFLREGRRQVGLKLWADLSEAAPDVFALMMKEKEEEDDRETKRRAGNKVPGRADT